LHEQLCRRQRHAGSGRCNHCYFSIQLSHCILLECE
jgi:hypothetical protein